MTALGHYTGFKSTNAFKIILMKNIKVEKED
jgi:hypothetical protein